MSSIVSNNSSFALSVSQNIQASQIRYFKLAVDTLFLRMENNLADAEGTHFFDNEDHIIEKADQITEMYENLTLSDEKKHELRQYILKEADVFDSKFSATYDKIYIDNYLEFVKISDYDDFEAEKIKSEDQYKVKKCKEVVVDDSDSESEDDSVSMFSETQSDCDSSDSESESEAEEEDELIKKVRDGTFFYPKAKPENVIAYDSDSDSESESEDDSGGDLESERDYLEKENEDNVHFINHLKKELEKMKETVRDLGSKVAILTRENEVKDLKIKQLEALREQDNSIINRFIQNADSASKLIDERDEQIKNLKAVIDDLRTQKDENIEQIRQSKEDFDKMYNYKNIEVAKLQLSNEYKNKEIFYYESKVREMNEHTKLNNN
jgi:hypothetical protein